MAEERPKMACGAKINADNPLFKEPVDEQVKDHYFEEAKVARIGREAPDFAVSAFHNGQFQSVKLSDYRGKWVLLCFYPGDFTFV